MPRMTLASPPIVYLSVIFGSPLDFTPSKLLGIVLKAASRPIALKRNTAVVISAAKLTQLSRQIKHEPASFTYFR